MFDRYWWLRVVGALTSGAAAAGFAIWYAVYVLPIDLRASKLAFTGILAAVDVVFVLLGIAAYQRLNASLQRHREGLRLEAMNGNQDAIPLARPLLPQPPTMADGDTAFAVRLIPAWQQWTGTLIRVALSIGFGTAFVVALAQLVPLLNKEYALQCVAGHEQTCVRFLASITPVLAIFTWGAIIFAGQACAEFASLSSASVCLTVRADGIVRQRAIGHPQVIQWSDVGLFEVGRYEVAQGRNVKASRHYICFARRSAFTWGHAESAPATSPLVRLATAITARTGLQPRTFDPELVASDVVVRPSWVEKALSGFSIRLISVVLVVGVIAAFPLVPSPDIPLWAGFLVFCTFWAGMAFVRLGRSKPAPSPFQAVTSDEQVIAAQAGVIYEMTVGSYPLFVTNQVAFVILGLIATAFGAAFFYNEFDRSFLTNNGAPLVPVGPVSTIVCIGVMATGLAMVVGAVRARDTIVLAELGGVRKRWLLGDVFIPWERVESVERARYWGYPGYRAVSSQPKKVIGWPIEPFQPSRKPQEAGAVLTTPAQMAQVIAQRSGKPIQVRSRT